MKPIEKHVQDILHMTGKIIDSCGPRPAGSALSKKAAKILKAHFVKYCDTVDLDEFSHHPRAFLGHITVNATLFVIGAGLIFLGLPGWAALFYALGHLTNILEFGLYYEFIDRFYGKKQGANVVAVMEPVSDVRQQIVFSAHHDSAYEFRFLTFYPKLYYILVFSSTVVNWSLLAGLAAWKLSAVLLGAPWFNGLFLAAGAGISLVITLPFFFFLKKDATPGAGDNLASACLLLKLAELLDEKRKKKSFPKHTRIFFVSYDAEEAGLRGSRAFARHYKKQLRAKPTVNVNLDSLYDIKAMRYLVSDINGTVKLSQKLAKSLQDTGKYLGYKSKRMRMFYGFGATDAAELAKIGVQATSLVALSPDLDSRKMVYHTNRDDVAHLDPKMFEAVLEILNAFVMKKERELFGRKGAQNA